MRRTIIIAIVVLLIIAGAIYAISNKKRALADLPRPKAPIPSVYVVPIEKGSVNITAHYMGSIEPFVKSDVSTRISGTIVGIKAREGDLVKKGDLLATIDDRELVDKIAVINAELQAARQRYAAAMSAYETQRAIYERDVTLYNVGAISQEALQRSKANYEGAKAAMDAYNEAINGLTMNLSIAKTQASYAQIIAPFSGVVTKRWAEPGDMAIPGKPIISIEDTSSYKVTVQMPQEGLSALRVGTVARLTNNGQSMTAKITRIYPSLNKNLLGTLEISLKSSPFNLPTYSTVGVDIVTGHAEGLIVPEQALVKNTKGAFVYVVRDDVVNIKPVRLLGSGGGRCAISGDLKEGTLVVVAQEAKLMTLAEGSKVNAITTKEGA